MPVSILTQGLRVSITLPKQMLIGVGETEDGGSQWPTSQALFPEILPHCDYNIRITSSCRNIEGVRPGYKHVCMLSDLVLIVTYFGEIWYGIHRLMLVSHFNNLCLFINHACWKIRAQKITQHTIKSKSFKTTATQVLAFMVHILRSYKSLIEGITDIVRIPISSPHWWSTALAKKDQINQ